MPTNILGAIDALKLRSCATLFATVAPQEPVFVQVLEQFYFGMRCHRTLELLS